MCLVQTLGGWQLQVLPLLRHYSTVPGSEASSCHYGNLQTSADVTRGQNKMTHRNSDGNMDRQTDGERQRGKITGINK